MRALLLGCFLSLLYIPAHACNVCGCAAGSQSLGVLPESRKHFIGLQYQYRGYESRHEAHDGAAVPELALQRYHTLQLWGRYNLGKRVRLFGFLPYHSNSSFGGEGHQSVAGIGDISLLANVQLIAREDCGPDWKQSLVAGGGIKLPTGRADASSFLTEEGLPNMQPGTRSWDFMVNANYTIRNEKFGTNLDALATLTTPTPVQYKYGNRFAGAVTAFYWWQRKNWTLLPQAGICFEHTGRDYDNYRLGWHNDMTGGNQWYASAGAQLFYRHAGLHVSANQPICQDFANGLVRSRFRTEAGVLLFL